MKKITLFWLSLTFVCLFILFLLTPFYYDDYSNALSLYGTQLANANGQVSWQAFWNAPNKLQVYVDTFIHHETGRFFTASYIRLLSWLPHEVFSFFNALCFTILVFCVYFFSGVSRRWLPAIIGLCVFTLLLENSVIWMAGAINYVWPVAGNLALAYIFQSKKMSESPFKKGNRWLLLFAPISFLFAGGHELVSVPMSVAIGSYYLYTLFRECKIPFDGRLFMTIGYAIGTALVVFDPRQLGRASLAGTMSHNVYVAYKLAMLQYGFLFNIWFYVVLVTLIYMLRKRILRFDSLLSYSTIVYLCELIVICLFGNAERRAYWDFMAFSMIYALILLRKSGFRLSFRKVSYIAVILGSLAYFNTLISTEIKRERFNNALQGYLHSSDNIMVIEEEPDWLLALFFDHSFPLNAAIKGVGIYDNRGLAILNGREHVIGLPKETASFLRDGNLCNEEHRLNIPGEWYYYPEYSIILSPISEEKLLPKVSTWAFAKYDDTKETRSFCDLLQMSLKNNFRLCVTKDIRIFKMNSFVSNLFRDLVYGTVLSNHAYIGFVVEEHGQRYCVLDARATRKIGCITEMLW